MCSEGLSLSLSLPLNVTMTYRVTFVITSLIGYNGVTELLLFYELICCWCDEIRSLYHHASQHMASFIDKVVGQVVSGVMY